MAYEAETAQPGAPAGWNELSEAGFAAIALHGDEDHSPYGPDSVRLLVIAGRP